MTTWGFIGSGNIGSTVAKLAILAGHDVVLSNSRGPETLEALVDRARPAGPSRHRPDAAAAGDVIVLTIPLKAYATCPPTPLRGKVVIDTMNYYPERDGQVAELDDESTTTSELLQPPPAGVEARQGLQQHLLRAPRHPRPVRPATRRRSALAIAGDDDGRQAGRHRGARRHRLRHRRPRPASRRVGAPSATRRHTATMYAADPADWAPGRDPAPCAVREGARRRGRKRYAATRPADTSAWRSGRATMD